MDLRTTRGRRRGRARARGWLAAAALAGSLVARPARASDALSATVDRVWIRSDSLKIDYQVRGLFSERVRETLSRGVPATYTCTIELWRDRAGWWDALEARKEIEYKIRRNVWNDRYVAEDPVNGQFWFPNLDALEHQLCARLGEFVALANELPTGKSYYVVLMSALRPLTIEDIREVEGWLTGEYQRGRKRSGISFIANLPRAIFGVFVDVSGLGDRSTLVRSGRFRLDRLAVPREGDRDTAERPG